MAAHAGQIRPGSTAKGTRFEIRLPVEAPGRDGGAIQADSAGPANAVQADSATQANGAQANSATQANGAQANSATQANGAQANGAKEGGRHHPGLALPREPLAPPRPCYGRRAAWAGPRALGRARRRRHRHWEGVRGYNVRERSVRERKRR